MAKTVKQVRQRVSIPSGIARRVRALAKRRRTSANRMIVELIETGLEAREWEKRTFFELAERLAQSTDAPDQKRLKEELARMTFAFSTRRRSKTEDRLDGAAAMKALGESAERIPYQKVRRDLVL